jgi:uncharacterized protein YjbJ (UPF0337 family)
MNEEKLKGKGNEYAGRARKAAGDLTDNEEMQSEGAAQETKGKAQGAWGDIKDKAEDIKDKFD